MRYFNKLLFSFLLFFLLIVNVNAFGYSEVNSKNVYLYDLDNNQLLYDKDSTEKISIASLTKIMTVIVALEKIDDVNEKVILSNKVFTGIFESGAAVVGFKVGEEVTYLDLMYGAMLPSGADAAQAIAVNVSGSLTAFIELMNKKTKELGLNNTNFVNVTGLDEEGQYSTVEDVFKLLKYALNNTIFNKMFTSKSYTSTNGIAMYSTLVTYSKNSNINTKYILGAKTGFTEEAGLCMASISNTGEIHLALITCNAPVDSKKTNHIKDATNIFKYYNDNFKEITLLEKNELIASIKTEYDKSEFINFYSQDEIRTIVPSTVKEKSIKIKYNGINLLTTKNKINDKLGVVSVNYDNETYYTTDIILKDEINFNIFRFIKVNWFILLLVGFLSLFIYVKIFRKLKRRRKNLIYKKYNPKMFDFK